MTVSGAATINDNTLAMAGGHTGTGAARVDETKCLGASVAPCPGGTLALSVFSDGGQKLQDHIEFPFQSKVGVLKDIFVGGGVNGTASITGVQNTFSQIPEPATFLLIGSGLLGLSVLRRKRKA